MCQRVSLYRVKQIMSTHINIIMLIVICINVICVGLQTNMSVYMPPCQALYVCIVYTKVNLMLLDYMVTCVNVCILFKICVWLLAFVCH